MIELVSVGDVFNVPRGRMEFQFTIRLPSDREFTVPCDEGAASELMSFAQQRQGIVPAQPANGSSRPSPAWARHQPDIGPMGTKVSGDAETESRPAPRVITRDGAGNPLINGQRPPTDDQLAPGETYQEDYAQSI